MRFASVAEVKNHLSASLAQARKEKKPIVVTHHGKPYALIQPISGPDLEELGWGGSLRIASGRPGKGRMMPSMTTFRRG